MFDKYVIDASMGCKGGAFTFCPIQGDINGEFSVIIGMNIISTVIPDKVEVVGVWHPDGQESVETFCKKYEKELKALKHG